MTISPPAKVNLVDSEKTKVLASNFDKLDLSINVNWITDDQFIFLEEKRELAAKDNRDVSLCLTPLLGDEKWHCKIKPYGFSGYAWMLVGQEFTIKIGNWLEPIDRPSVFVEIRSETLWRLGAELAIERIINIIKGLGKGALIDSIKPSRTDLCLDLLMPSHNWNAELKQYAVTRATKMAVYFQGKKVEGIGIGRGIISARLYNKPLEIQQQSKKYWMYDVWGLDKDQLTDDQRIIRTEFQLRRQIIKELGLDTIEDLLNHQGHLWGYCTKKWLKFRDRPGKHHTQRKTLDWWVMVQNGYRGVSNPNPLIRYKAMNAEYERLCLQAGGLLSSMEAVNMETFNPDGKIQPVRSLALTSFNRALNTMGKGPMQFIDEVNEKRVKYKRSKEKALALHDQRLLLGFPDN